MKKSIGILAVLSVSAGLAYGQSATGAYGIAQPDLKGTARYMGMAGAFGALGGDLSAISQNPAGIGVYRSSDLGFTLDLDLQNSTTQGMLAGPNNRWTAQGPKYNMDQTKFLLNNIGGVLTLKLNNKLFPNINFGFTYNKGVSFNRIYGGNINGLRNSMSNYIADTSNYEEISEGDVSWSGGMDPYNPDYGYYAAPWMNILAANAQIIMPQETPEGTNWYGLWQNSMSGNSTQGVGSFVMEEKGGTNDFNIVLGGNIADKLYWGMNFQISNLSYRQNQYWGETLSNAFMYDDKGNPTTGNAYWDYNGAYTLTGTGFSYQLGLIYKPVQAFRLGFTFHTPTWYSLQEEFIGSMSYDGDDGNTYDETNSGIPGYSNYNLRTPWKIIASAAGVIGNSLIVSFDYEWANYGKMRYYEPASYDGYYDDWYWGPWYSATRAGGFAPPNFDNSIDPYYYSNIDIADYYKSTNTFRVGVEIKPINALSIRAGYSHVSSPVRKEVKQNEYSVFTSPLAPSYRLDNQTNYLTCGIGFRYSHFYADLAYVYKHMSADYHAYTPWTPVKINGEDVYVPTDAPQSKVSLTNNQIVLSLGYRF